MTFESVSRTYTEREPFNPLNNIKDAANKVGNGVKKGASEAGKGVQKGASEAGKGINMAVDKTTGGLKAFPSIVMKNVLGPVWKFIKSIGAWLKFVFCMLCCLCIISSCTSLGIPQMIFSAISAARSSASTVPNTQMPEYTYMQTP